MYTTVAKRMSLLVGLIFVLSTVTPALSTLAACSPPGCIPNEHGEYARWWPDRVDKATCPGHHDKDWIVWYNVNSDTWVRADISRIRFHAPDWNVLVHNFYKFAQVEAIDAQPPVIRLCVSDLDGALTAYEAWKTWVWLKR